MARKKSTPPVPVSPVRGKSFWLDGKLGAYDRRVLVRLIEARGGSMQADIDDDLDYLVLNESRRGSPGRSQAEKAAAKLTGASITTIYTNDLFTLLLLPRDEALALLAGGAATREVWNESLPPYRSPYAVDLAGADLSGLDLSEFRFHNCDLTGVKLDGATVTGAHFHNARGVDFRTAGPHEKLSIAEAHDCRFDGLDLSGSHIFSDNVGCSFRGTKLREAYLGGSLWTDCNLSEADLAGARSWGWRTSGLVAEKADFTGASLPNTNLTGAKLGGAVFNDAALERGTFADADLRGASFQRATLSQAVFTNADLRQADFRGANLAEADFTGAKLTGADFTGANLRNATLDPGKQRVKGLDSGGKTAGPLLAQLERDLAGVRQWELAFALESPTHGRLACQLRWRYDRRVDLKWPSATGTHESAAADVGTAVLDLATLFPDGVPDLDSVKIKPTSRAKTLEPLACQALCEAFGQPVPELKDLGQAKKAARAKTTAGRAALIAELCSGAEAVTAWNARPEVERAALSDFRGADFTGAYLHGIALQKANLVGATFEKADLGEANLYAAKMRKANLREANLHKASLFFAALHDANAEGADLREANLKATRWGRANLKKANLRGASLAHAAFEGADLTGADLTDTQPHATTYDSTTKFPAGFSPGEGWHNTGKTPHPAAAAAPVVAPPREALDFAAFFARLPVVAEAGRIKNAITMLKAERFSLFAETGDDQVIGVVRSQSSRERVYACRLTSAGGFECGTQNLRICGGLQGMVCKHLLVLILGLTKAGKLDSGTAYQWLQLARKQSPGFDKEVMTATFLKYKGVEAGEVDWRPTETVPEDYYAL